MLELQRVEDEECLAAAFVKPRSAHDAEDRVGLGLEVLRFEVELLEGSFKCRVELALPGLAG